MISVSDQKQIPLLNRLPATRIRLWVARTVYRLIHLFLREDQRRIRRRGVNYQLDLSEGIDLSLFLFGGFQDHVTHGKYFHLPADAVIFDVGANIGAMALQYARVAPQGRVYAFEPTDYAYERLTQNLFVNPELSSRIVPVQALMSDHPAKEHSLVAYSSWKINGRADNAHPLHGGSRQSTGSAPVLTIDEFCQRQQIQRVDLIKIDTDGHELQILYGARTTLAKYHPYLIFEVGLYLMQENDVQFGEFFSYLSSFGYSLLNNKNGEEIGMNNYLRQIPLRSTIDILAMPPRQIV